MRAYSTERLVLVGSVYVVLKNLGCKDTVVTVDVLDRHVEPFGEGFETNL
jgi:hypothetical protein